MSELSYLLNDDFGLALPWTSETLYGPLGHVCLLCTYRREVETWKSLDLGEIVIYSRVATHHSLHRLNTLGSHS